MLNYKENQFEYDLNSKVAFKTKLCCTKWLLSAAKRSLPHFKAMHTAIENFRNDDAQASRRAVKQEMATECRNEPEQKCIYISEKEWNWENFARMKSSMHAFSDELQLQVLQRANRKTMPELSIWVGNAVVVRVGELAFALNCLNWLRWSFWMGFFRWLELLQMSLGVRLKAHEWCAHDLYRETTVSGNKRRNYNFFFHSSLMIWLLVGWIKIKIV